MQIEVNQIIFNSIINISKDLSSLGSINILEEYDNNFLNREILNGRS